ncbi:MAG TPA: branched-chain amino acid ABC transporter ATP-binding protein/permease [Acidimicrobiales bacterium]|nr:branched-chain amino acid ABC transporter ATP-binding protein/permease [Acidimicrobiales bacterium]
MGSYSFYISTLVVYFAIDLLCAWSLNLQYGYAGVINFAFIVFQAAGAYAASVVVLGSDTGINSYQTYILGTKVPFPLPLVAAAFAGAFLSGLVGLFALRRIRRDYQAAVMLIVSLILFQAVSADVHLFNGSNGLTGIPHPFQTSLGVSLSTYQWIYAGWVLAICVVMYFVVQALCKSSWGRALKAIRDQDDAAGSLGLNGTLLRMQVFMIGGAIAGLSGGLLVEFIGAWSPGAWGYAETFVIFTALLVGGVGNNRGMLLGTLIVPIVVLQIPTFLPAFGYPGLVDAIQWMVIGLLWMLFLLVRPRGLMPERRYVATRPGSLAPRSALGGLAVRMLTLGRDHGVAGPHVRSPRVTVPEHPLGEGGPTSTGNVAIMKSVTGTSPEQPVSGPASRLDVATREPVMVAQELVVRYGGVAAVQGVSFEVFPGEIVGLIGPNGAGKSSVLAALAGQLRPRGGVIRLGGRDVTKSPPYARARLGLARTFQTTSEFPGMTVFENLLVSSRGATGASLWHVAGRWRTNRAEDRAAEARAWEVLDRFEMTETANAYGAELSGGQRRLVEIMRCLMRDPALLLLDEPMVGVAPHLVKKISSDLREVADEGIGMVLVEHALDVVSTLCDRVVVMALGRVIAQGTYDEVVTDQGVRDAYLG